MIFPLEMPLPFAKKDEKIWNLGKVYGYKTFPLLDLDFSFT